MLCNVMSYFDVADTNVIMWNCNIDLVTTVLKCIPRLQHHNTNAPRPFVQHSLQMKQALFRKQQVISFLSLNKLSLFMFQVKAHYSEQ